MTSVSAGLSVSGECTAERFQYAEDRYPDIVMLDKGYGCGAASIKKKSDLEGAIREMIAHKGPHLLDVQVPYQEHVLPMIPGGLTVDDMILD